MANETNIMNIIEDLEAKAQDYNKKYLPVGWTKSIDTVDEGFILVNPDRKTAYKFNSIYISARSMNQDKYTWGFSSDSLTPKIKDKIKEVGEQTLVLNMMNGDFCSNYSFTELFAMSSAILQPDSFIALEFPDNDLAVFYFLYGEPTKINI